MKLSELFKREERLLLTEEQIVSSIIDIETFANFVAVMSNGSEIGKYISDLLGKNYIIELHKGNYIASYNEDLDAISRGIFVAVYLEFFAMLNMRYINHNQVESCFVQKELEWSQNKIDILFRKNLVIANKHVAILDIRLQYKEQECVVNVYFSPTNSAGVHSGSIIAKAKTFNFPTSYSEDMNTFFVSFLSCMHDLIYQSAFIKLLSKNKLAVEPK